MNHCFKIINGDPRWALKGFKDETFQCVITSPPYWGGLRDYGVEGQIGNEKNLEDYIAALVDVFSEVRRVLRDDGTFWLNVGNKYDDVGVVGVAWQLADAMVTDGWVRRSAAIWSKTNAVPESVKSWAWEKCWSKGGESCPGCDKCRGNGGYVLRKGRWRPTMAHEDVFQFVKGDEYFADADAVRTPPAPATLSRDKYTRLSRDHADEQYAVKHDHETRCNPKGANRRSVLQEDPANAVWEFLSSRPGADAAWVREAYEQWFEMKSALSTVIPIGRSKPPYKHPATFPIQLPTTLIKASTPAGGVCAACKTPYAPLTDPYSSVVLNEWRATCNCKCPQPPEPALVLDPFSGSATTGRAALALGRSYVGVELNPEYCRKSERSLASVVGPLFANLG